MSNIRDEIKSVGRVLEGESVAPADELQQKFFKVVKKYGGKIIGELWTPKNGWATIEIGSYVQLAYSFSDGYQMKTTMNSHSYGFAEVDQWMTEVGQAYMIMTRLRAIKIPVKQ